MMVKVTKSAIDVIKSEVKDEINEGKKPFIRLAMGIGWGGPKLRLTLEESALDDDAVTEIEGIQFLVHEKDKVYFDEAKIDYVKTLFGGGEFKVLRVWHGKRGLYEQQTTEGMQQRHMRNPVKRFPFMAEVHSTYMTGNACLAPGRSHLTAE
jgi:Fe-S cluster assembly iron-binding protein IscA